MTYRLITTDLSVFFNFRFLQRRNTFCWFLGIRSLSNFQWEEFSLWM